MFRHLPVARQIIALVVAAVLATAGAMVAITLIGPPPRPAPTPMADIVLSLQGAATDHPAARPIRRLTSAEPPTARRGEIRDPAIEQWLARRLASEPRDLRAFVASSGPGPRKDDELRGEGSFGWFRDERWQIVLVDPHPTSVRWWWTVAAATALLLGAIICVAWLSARTITRPLERLAAAARSSQRGQPWNAAIDGPPEVAVVAEALAAFQREQVAHVAQRTRMLSAIAHDLGTPLMRLAFRIEALPEAPRDAAFGEIEVMRRLIADTLALDRSGGEPAFACDLAELVNDMVEECRALGLPVAADRIEPASVMASEVALRRLLQNLIDNALRYGNAARLSLATVDGAAELAVRDRGPGFSTEMLEHGCEPFVRGEASRNRETGGSGLGLAIATAIASQHRGSLELRNLDGGGEALVRLPLAVVSPAPSSAAR